MTIRITENELVDALLAAIRPEDTSDERGAMTVKELADATGRADLFVRRNIKALLGAGKMEVVKVRRPAIDGSLRVLPAYRLKAAQ